MHPSKIWIDAIGLPPRLAYHAVKQWCAYFPVDRVLLPRGLRAVSVTFDDFPSSSVEVGGEILKEYGARGTYYACMSRCEEELKWQRGEKLFRLRDLELLREQGHELACHSYEHPNFLMQTTPSNRNSVETNARILEELAGQSFLPHFAFPYGQFRPSARHHLRRYFKSLRTIYPGAQHGAVDLMALSSSPLLRDTPRSKVLSQIRDVADNGGWLIFYTHEVAPKPTEFGITPEGLEEVASTCRKFGVEMLGVDQVVKRLRN